MDFLNTKPAKIFYNIENIFKVHKDVKLKKESKKTEFRSEDKTL